MYYRFAKPLLSAQRKDALLQPLQKPPRMRAVHLGVVELEYSCCKINSSEI